MVSNMTNKVTHCDVVIVGAGLVGLATVIALAEQGLDVVLVDAAKKNAAVKEVWDDRIYAITPSTEQWLTDLGVWSAIHQKRVSDVEGMALWHPESKEALQLFAEDANLAKMACIIENQNLMQALWQRVEKLGLPVMMEAPCLEIVYLDDHVVLHLENGEKVSASLLVAADGANSFVRKQLNVPTKVKEFNQTALVANYKAEKQHGRLARQWFSPHETLALLPLSEQYVSMVWAVSTEMALELLNLTKQELAIKVQAASDNNLGELKPVSDAKSFVLRQVTAMKQVVDRVVFVGDAAHQVHPMAGQGANLGFRDVMALQALMSSRHSFQDVGDTLFLRQYERVRKADIISMNMLTSGLDGLFSAESGVIKEVTGFGFLQLNNYPSVRRFLIKQAVA